MSETVLGTLISVLQSLFRVALHTLLSLAVLSYCVAQYTCQRGIEAIKALPTRAGLSVLPAAYMSSEDLNV
ncbi:hypothetical protein CPB85DRAFT_1310065 [Mucidula mucida]|nr:hypothetical protein CPB85DRAFT_1310065 [Mucidula mucida]